MLSLPFFLFLMTSVASILTMNTLKKSNNFKFIIVGIITSVAIYYFNYLKLMEVINTDLQQYENF